MSPEETAENLKCGKTILYIGLNDNKTYYVRYNGFFLVFSEEENFSNIVQKIRCKGTDLINFAEAIRNDILE